MASAAGLAPATSTFARWRSDLTELRGQKWLAEPKLADRRMASVIGLAPIRPDLKGRLRELLCIHGQIERKAKHGVVCSQADINSVNRGSFLASGRASGEACAFCK